MAKARLKHIIISLTIGGLFIFLAGRIAFVHQYPMAYDEDYHYGLIQMYTERLNPFVSNQPTSLDRFGAVQADGSHLYHYALSFPLRFVKLFTNTELTYFWMLRAISIGLGLVTLYLTYRLARRFGHSARVAYGVTAVIAVTPVFYDLAAHVNYDNLLIPLSLLALLKTWDAIGAARQGEFRAGIVLQVVLIGLAATLVKYSFLPLAFGAFAVLTVYVLRYIGVRRTFDACRAAVHRKPSVRYVALSVVTMVLAFAWLRTYGVNIAIYHTPHPQCHVVLSVERCQSYGPWARNYGLYETRSQRPVNSSPVYYVAYWLRTMHRQLYTTVKLQADGSAVFPQSRLFNAIGIFCVVVGATCVLLWRKSLHKVAVPWTLITMACGCYVLTLWGQNYSDFRNLHEAVATQGRYLLPVLPVVYIVLAAGYSAGYKSARLLLGQARSTGAATYVAVTRIVMNKLYAASLMTAVKASGATYPTRREMRFIAQ